MVGFVFRAEVNGKFRMIRVKPYEWPDSPTSRHDVSGRLPACGSMLVPGTWNQPELMRT